MLKRYTANYWFIVVVRISYTTALTGKIGQQLISPQASVDNTVVYARAETVNREEGYDFEKLNNNTDDKYS